MIPFYFLSEISKYCQILQKKIGILVQTALILGWFWTIFKLAPKSALLCTILIVILHTLMIKIDKLMIAKREDAEGDAIYKTN